MPVNRFGIASLFALLAGATACQPEMPREFVEVSSDSTASSALAGYWRWVSSSVGDDLSRPVVSDDSMVFRIGPYGGYQERAGDRVHVGRYWLTEGHLFQTQDSSFTVLLMDSSFFFRQSVEDYHAVAVRQFDGRTLVLSGTGTDATLHTFSRVIPKPRRPEE